MKPEDRKRLKQHIEMIVEHKEPEAIVRENFKQLQDEVADLREKNIKLRLELKTLRFKESQESRFVWWIYQVYARNVLDLIQSIPVMCPCETEKDVPFIELAERIKDYTEHIYDGTYLDTAMSTEQSNSDVSMTRDVSIDIKTPSSIENTNPDYYKQEIDRLNAERRWIPISEPPKVKGEYICYSKPDIFTCFFGDSWDGGLAFRSVIQPTHWMPLPEPPEEERC